MKNRMVRLLVFSLLVFNILVSSTSVFADGSIVTIDLKGESKETLDFSKRRLKIWKISSESKEIDKRAIIDKLKDLSDGDLNKNYGKHIVSPESDKDGKIILSLDKGTYYVREIETSHKVKLYPFAFQVDKEKNINIIPKGGGENPPGESKLIKISENEKRLAGAKFELYKVENSKIEKVGLENGVYSKNGSKDQILVTDSQGEINIYNLPAGDYMFREIEAPEGYEIRQEDHYFTVIAGKINEIKIINFRQGHGGFRFRKESEDGIPLAKAKFKVTKKVKDKYETIKVNGKDYILESNRDGYFIVDGIEYGDYYLWEVKPPKGYSALSGPVKFTVNKESFDRIIRIEDKKIPERPPKNPPEVPSETPPGNPPEKPPIIIPKTGDITLILMLIVGLTLSISGYRIVKKNSVK